MSSRSTRWCFTINNYSLEDVELVYGNLNSHAHYLVVGRERGASGTLHLQGYVTFKESTRLSYLTQNFFSGRAHWEVAKGSGEENRVYCTKSGDFYESGSLPSRSEAGNREANRWEQARQLAKEGDIDSIDAQIYISFYRSLKDIKKDHMIQQPDLEGLNNVWIWGASGIGKSKHARELSTKFYYKLANKWWDGYQGEEDVLIEDLDPSHKVLAHHLKLWADRYSFNAETKGGMINIRPKRIIITSQYNVEEIFDNDPYTCDAIHRRFQLLHME